MFTKNSKLFNIVYKNGGITKNSAKFGSYDI